MARTTLLVLLASATLLPGCGRGPEPPPPPARYGRFLGIGIYPAGPLWSRIVREERGRDAAAARADDDAQVIVVVDSRTGEIRQCGNFTGYCIGMNPWAAAPGRAAPVPLREHAADLERMAETESRGNAAAATDANATAVAPSRR